MHHFVLGMQEVAIRQFQLALSQRNEDYKQIRLRVEKLNENLAKKHSENLRLKVCVLPCSKSQLTCCNFSFQTGNGTFAR